MPLKSSLAFDMLIQSVNYKPSVCSCYALHTTVYKIKPEWENVHNMPDTCSGAT